MDVFALEVIEENDLGQDLVVTSHVHAPHHLDIDLRRSHLIVKIRKIVISLIN